MWAIRDPMGPMLKGITYRVRPRIEPLKRPFNVAASLGGRPSCCWAGIDLVARADEGPVLHSRHVAWVRAAEEAVGTLFRIEPEEGAGLTISSVSWSYSACDPSHQYTRSG